MVERAAPSLLPGLAVAIATAFLFSAIRHEAFRLLRRTRWLMLVLLLSYAYTLPGTAWWPTTGWLSPSVEGVQQGALRVARLGLMLAGLAVLLATTTRPRLLYGLYGLARPLVWLGLDRRAFAVRLGLTLDYVEGQSPSTRWLEMLREPLPDEGEPASYTLHAERWQSRDSAVILAGVLLVGWVLG